MIKKLYKKSIPVVFSLLTLTSCKNEKLESSILGIKQFLQNSTQNFADDFKPEYDDSMLKKWYKIQDQKNYAERMLGPNNYEDYDIVVPFTGGKWTRTSYVPIIEDLFRKYTGLKESWPEHKKRNHLEHYVQYLDNFLIKIGKDADFNRDNVISKKEFETLRRIKFLDS